MKKDDDSFLYLKPPSPTNFKSVLSSFFKISRNTQKNKTQILLMYKINNKKTCLAFLVCLLYLQFPQQPLIYTSKKNHINKVMHPSNHSVTQTKTHYTNKTTDHPPPATYSIPPNVTFFPHNWASSAMPLSPVSIPCDCSHSTHSIPNCPYHQIAECVCGISIVLVDVLLSIG